MKTVFPSSKNILPVFLALTISLQSYSSWGVNYTNDASTTLLDHFAGSTLGTIIGPAVFTNGLTALDQCIRIPASSFVMYASAIPYQTSGTYEVWVKPSQWPCSLMCVNWTYSTSQPGAGYVMHLTLNANGTVHWYGNGNFDSVNSVPTNEWTHIAVTWGAGGTSIFINGIEDAHTAAKYTPGNGYLYLNSSWGAGNIGCVDELRVSSVARTAAELRSHYLENIVVRHQVSFTVQGAGLVAPGSGQYVAGTNLNLSATPDPGWLFMGWSGDLTGGYSSSNLTLQVDGPKQITASFSQDADGDGLLNTNEWSLGTDPRNHDTDGDGFDDNFELNHGYSPLVSDSALTEYIRTNSNVFALYPSNAVLNVAIGQALGRVTNGLIRMNLQLQQAESLTGTWTDAGNVVEWTMPAEGQKQFFRIQSSPSQP